MLAVFLAVVTFVYTFWAVFILGGFWIDKAPDAYHQWSAAEIEERLRMAGRPVLRTDA